MENILHGNKDAFIRDAKTFFALLKRGLKIFLSDKMSVFLSLLAPLIILMLYVLFLSDIQLENIESALEGMPIEHGVMQGIVDGWMLAGVLATSCITVGFSSQTVLIGDRESGVLNDMLTSPIKRSLLNAGYIACNFVITLVITLIVLAIALIYLAATNWYLSAADIGECIGILLLSVLSSSLLSGIICIFIRTQSQHGGLTGILSAAIGFFIGAYMPISIFPKAIQYMALFIHGSYSAGIFRNVFTRGALEKVAELSPIVAESINANFSMNMDAFGTTIYKDDMWIILAAFTVVLAIVLGTLYSLSSRSNSFINIFIRNKSGKKKK